MNARGADEPTRCRSCGAALPVGTPVCAECGEPTAPPERKLVTLLFMDMTGYTELVSRLDPEDVHDFVRPAMTALRRVVESFGGSVPQMLGDGFMAVFGAPVGHEDDAARALHAAVALHSEVAAINRSSERLRVPALHVGVNTGEVLVAASREVGGFSVAGDPVNTAARLCSAAEPGQTLVGERTVELARHGLRFGPVRMRRLRGLPDKVAVYELLGLDVGAVARRPTGTFVGRRDALGYLHAALDDMVAARRSRVLVIAGEAGQGKSRLASEFLARRAGVTVLSGRSTPYGRRRPLQALIDAVATHLGVTPEATQAEVEAAVRRAFGHRGTPALAARVAYLIGAGDDRREASPEADVAALRAVLAAAAEAQPVILLIEDLQWADPELVDVVCAIHAAPLAAPVLVLALTRPELETPRPLPSRELGALPDDDMRTLLADLLGEEPPEWLTSAMLTRAGGNPLFLEECTRMLLETGGISRGADGVDADRTQVRRVPNSMRMFIAARLDGLPPAEKRLLQRASVAGDTFHAGVLSAMSDEPHLHDVLDSLVDRGLLRDVGGDEYHFKHVLIRDVAYESLARRDRSALHRVVAEWLSAEPSPPVPLLAYHFHQAYILARSDSAGVQPSCELARLAVSHLLAWGRSLYRYQARAAEAALSQAVDVAQSSRQCIADELYATLLVERANALNELLRFGEAIEDLRTAEDLAAGIGDDVLRARALLTHSLSLSHVSRLDQARDLHAQAVGLLQRAGDVGMLAAATFQAAENLRYDDLPRMTRLLREAHDLYREAGDEAGQAMVARYLAYLLSPAGGAEFRRWYGVAEASSASEAELRGRATVRCAYAFHLQYRGEFALALEAAVLGQADAAESGTRWREIDGLLIQQECLSALGRLEESDRVLGELLTRAESLGSARLRSIAVGNATRASARSRRTALAWQQLREGRAGLARIGDRTAELTVLVYESELLMDSGRWSEGAAAADRAVDRAEAQGWSLAATGMRLIQARCAVADGSERAESLVAEAMDAARRHDAPRYGALAAACLEQLSLLAGAGESATLAPSSGDLAETRATAAENEGLRLLRAGSPSDAAAAFERAAAAWVELGATVWLARALVWQAQSLRRAGDDAGAARVEEPVAALLTDLDVPQGLAGRLRSMLPA
ncbi:MAG TPA: adenylate/guanylate cyclase domain-containing protein [Frankiaceae bacterium]|jgi:class 3 adenylate cyclase|nr:adenylate/guanylate cyclase domain-containing protein [Frankiaceae bacterium]